MWRTCAGGLLIYECLGVWMWLIVAALLRNGPEMESFHAETCLVPPPIVSERRPGTHGLGHAIRRGMQADRRADCVRARRLCAERGSWCICCGVSGLDWFRCGCG